MYSTLRDASSAQARQVASGMSPCEKPCMYCTKPSLSVTTVNSPMLMEVLPPPRSGAFSRATTSMPHSSALQRQPHSPAPP